MDQRDFNPFQKISIIQILIFNLLTSSRNLERTSNLNSQATNQGEHRRERKKAEHENGKHERGHWNRVAETTNANHSIPPFEAALDGVVLAVVVPNLGLKLSFWVALSQVLEQLANAGKMGFADRFSEETWARHQCYPILGRVAPINTPTHSTTSPVGEPLTSFVPLPPQVEQGARSVCAYPVPSQSSHSTTSCTSPQSKHSTPFKVSA